MLSLVEMLKTIVDAFLHAYNVYMHVLAASLITYVVKQMALL